MTVAVRKSLIRNEAIRSPLPDCAGNRRSTGASPVSRVVAGAIGYVTTFSLIARVEPDAWIAASFGAIPFTLGLGFFLDSALVRRDMHTS